LLLIAEDQQRLPTERLAAVEAIAKREDKAAAVDRLLRLLEGDLRSPRLVYILGEIGDPRALPTLRRMEHNLPSGIGSGKMRSALVFAIKQLEQVPPGINE
jgi:hypothetical protein